jgi:hypothetical protein
MLAGDPGGAFQLVPRNRLVAWSPNAVFQRHRIPIERLYRHVAQEHTRK